VAKDKSYWASFLREHKGSLGSLLDGEDDPHGGGGFKLVETPKVEHYTPTRLKERRKERVEKRSSKLKEKAKKRSLEEE